MVNGSSQTIKKKHSVYYHKQYSYKLLTCSSLILTCFCYSWMLLKHLLVLIHTSSFTSFHINFGQHWQSSYKSSNLSSLSKGTHSVFASKPFPFKNTWQSAGTSGSLNGTAVHKFSPNSGSKDIKRMWPCCYRCRIRTYMQYPRILYEIDVKILYIYHPCFVWR